MADIELVIKIDEELYNYMQTEVYDEHMDKRFDYRIRFAVKNGTPLPKGHGRLIDENQLLEEIRNDIVGNFDNLEYWLSATDTIIEADKKELE